MIKKIKRFKITLLFILLCIILFIFNHFPYALPHVDFTPWDYQKLTDIEARIELIDEPNNSGKVLVTEQITFNVHQAKKSNLCYKLYLYLPEQENDGIKLDYTVLSVKQILDDGTKIPYEQNSKLLISSKDCKNGKKTWYHSKGPYSRLSNQHEGVFLYVDGIYRDEITFEITYEMNNVALSYGDCSSLQLLLYSHRPIKDLNSYKAEILIPNKDMPDKDNYDYYSFGTNGESFPVNRASDLNPGYYTFLINLGENELKFKPYNLYLEFDLIAYGADKHIFTDYSPLNKHSSEDALDEITDSLQKKANKYKTFAKYKYYTVKVALYLSVVIIITTLLVHDFIKKKYIFYNPTESAKYHAGIPDNLDFGFAATLVFSKSTKNKYYSGIYSALLLSLSRKKYINIEQYGKKDITITINDISDLQKNSIIPLDTLTESETLYYDLLTRHAIENTICMSELQNRLYEDYEYTATFAKNIGKAFSREGTNKKLFQTADYTQPKDKILLISKIYFYIGLILTFPVNIISFHTRMDLVIGMYAYIGLVLLFCSLYLKCNAGKYVLLTQKGEDEYAKWRGLYNYLKSDYVFSNSHIKNRSTREIYFIYATAFGIPSKITKTLGFDSSSHTNTSADTYDSILSNTYINTGYFHRSGHRIRRAVNRGARFHRRTTGYGYTGGGRSWSSYGGGGS